MSNKTKADLKVAIYCRVASANDFAIKTQEETLRNYAAENMLDVRGVFSDNGASGSNIDRLAFQKMMSGIKNGEINCVIVKDIARISRNHLLYGKWIYDMCKKGIRVISVNEGYDNANSPDTLNKWYTEVERLYKEQLSQKIKLGIAYSRQRNMDRAKQ